MHKWPAREYILVSSNMHRPLLTKWGSVGSKIVPGMNRHYTRLGQDGVIRWTTLAMADKCPSDATKCKMNIFRKAIQSKHL